MSKRKPHGMFTTVKCREILEEIVRRCNDPAVSQVDAVVGFARDWGGNSLTLLLGDGHTHVGDSDSEFWELVESLHAALIGGRGLSVVAANGSSVRQNPPEIPG